MTRMLSLIYLVLLAFTFPGHSEGEDVWPDSASKYLARHKMPEPILRPTGVAGDFDSDQTDCPCVVWDADGERWVMAYAGWDGQKNQLGLAESKDLIHWKRVGRILGTGQSGSHDQGSASGPFLIRHDGWWYLFYVGFPEDGYEAGPGTTNIARSQTLENFEHWASAVIQPGTPEAWDGGGIYKFSPFQIGNKFFGFFNAKDKDGMEQTGLATSEDLREWKKDPSNPILRTQPGVWDSRFNSDPYLLKIEDRWHLFYFGFDGKVAQEGVAISADGGFTKWAKYPGNPILRVGPPGSYDWKYAHKPCVVEHGGVYYHFYCGVGEERAICLATSQDISSIQ